MQTTSRPHDVGRGYGRRGAHAPQLSISDDNHHVTEVLGTMYGENQYEQGESRPLSFVSSASEGSLYSASRQPAYQPQQSRQGRHDQARSAPNRHKVKQSSPRSPTASERSFNFERNGHGQITPNLSPQNSLSERSNSETATSAFPLNDTDYESNPDAVAQELSNLQALRRMSMDVTAADPDLPSFSSSRRPNTAPTGAESDDSAKTFWVPARLHPELAPTEFKTFLDKKVESIKRRSLDRSLSVEGLPGDDSSGSLKRKKSMLSRQIDNSGGRGGEGYQDGAERLDRKRSLSGAEALNTPEPSLHELESLYIGSEDGQERLSIDTGHSIDIGEATDDVPILPAPPTGGSLRRSTRTTYRRGSLKKGERIPPSRRAGASKSVESDVEESAVPSPNSATGEGSNLSRVQTEPTPVSERVAENFSRPGRGIRRGMLLKGTSANSQQDPPSASQPSTEFTERPSADGGSIPPKHFVSQIASNGRSSISPQVFGQQIPQIVESPPPAENVGQSSRQGRLPERTSSHEPPPTGTPKASFPAAPFPRGGKRVGPSRQGPNDQNAQTLRDMASHPSPLPGNSTRTDSLSFIPTLTEDKKADNKRIKEKKEKEPLDGSRKSSWSWGGLLGGEDKEKEKKKEEEARKAKLRPGKPVEKGHDNTRLDLLQTTMDGTRGRESLVLDRGDIKLEEERQKQSNKKALGTEGKKEKDAGLFHSLFGGGKKKGEKEAAARKHPSRGLSPEPPPRILKPDIDYAWTRFSILEERAIYRMAHIKLANPRRALHSQVLLSNFMYSYLAKVQQMHPHMQIPQSAAQKQQQQQQQQQAQQKKADQPEEFAQYQRYQEQQKKQQQMEDLRSQGQAGSAPENQPYETSETHDGNSYENHQQDGLDGTQRLHYSAHDNNNNNNNSGALEKLNGSHSHHPQHAHPSQQQQQHQHPPGNHHQYQSQFDDPGRGGGGGDDDDMW